MEERIVLVIDDQYGQNSDPMIPTLYGEMPGYEFILEDSFDGKNFNYMKAIERIRNEKKIDIILLDMAFGINFKYGLLILEKIKESFPEMKVLMLSSETNPYVISRCKELGAEKFIPKMPNIKDMENILDQY